SNGEANTTTTTDADGRARAHLITGPETGMDRQRVTAHLTNTAASTGFTASALMPGDPAQTRISGIVLDNQNTPVPNVRVRIEGSTRQATTTNDGRFSIAGAPAGPVHLIIEGSTTDRPGQWPQLSYNLVTVPGHDNTLPAPVYLVKLDTENAKTAGAEDATITNPSLPGLSLFVKAGSVTFPDGSKTGKISITRVNTDKIPMALPNGTAPSFFITIQPHGALFDPAAPIAIPNADGLPPLYETDLYSYDHDLEEFVVIGTGQVSKDGRTIKSKPGAGIVKAGWFGGPTPPSGSGDTGNSGNSGPSPDPLDKKCNDGSSQGCPIWSVNEKTLNVNVTDTPLW
ncbi:MAG: carboxypeptidase-like regulatory domain-containing protein, partial [Proteobacteria bacterium]|nr:carboxypeptidase-like regulatory domain-containing protein [Pseudomonadota bacterium]